MKKSRFLQMFGLIVLAFLLQNCTNAERPKTREERVAEVAEKIKSTPEWLEMVRKKATEQNVSLDTMIQRDAVWTVDDADGKHKK